MVYFPVTIDLPLCDATQEQSIGAVPVQVFLGREGDGAAPAQGDVRGVDAIAVGAERQEVQVPTTSAPHSVMSGVHEPPSPEPLPLQATREADSTRSA
jgi:hypothetical protein